MLVEEFQDIEHIIEDLRDLDGEFLTVDMKDSRTAPTARPTTATVPPGSPAGPLFFIQTTRTEDGSGYLVEAGMDIGKPQPRVMRLDKIDRSTCIQLFRDVLVKGLVPDFTSWEDVTEEIFYRSVEMNLFKTAYKVVRENSSEIYKGFGFKHLSDATQYYVHPDNQSYKGTTTLCQPIGEAVILHELLQQNIPHAVPARFWGSSRRYCEAFGRLL